MQLSVVVDFFFMTRLIGSALAFKPVELSGRPSVFSYMTLYAILLKNEIHFKTNKTSVNSMATGVGLACDL